MTMTGAQISVGGENLIDHVDNEGVIAAYAGGSPFNVARALGRQGARVRYISPISTDQWGDMLADILAESGVDLCGGRNDRPTTMARVRVHNRIPDYLFERDDTAERRVTEAALAASIGTDTCLLHTGSLALGDGADANVWEAVVANAYRRGIFVALDPNVRLSVIGDAQGYRNRIRRIAGHVHLIRLSDEDLAGLFPGKTEEAAMDALKSHTPARAIVLTRGAGGLSAWRDGQRIDLPATPVTAIKDTVGAGDTFMATLLAQIADLGHDPVGRLAAPGAGVFARMLARASVAAALTCERDGCDPPTRSELDEAWAARARAAASPEPRSRRL
ncbi:MAG: carbohydrate kinase [Rhodobacteraceae bacterium]|nr:carbohydrate kinase [Paracoccaceae bacterium]